ncbi:hypothetical protein [Propylenella binzhouense]|uniref:Uncharacterized protein n=1 Tax=Propylenella binzhouense TaxID=2555902 RepID=A0A964T883_9HYPH|nr:hypothetical protein [Propylenella binzhouense]MYZ50366.1 hypothetical protein [Propylenella binzhouense]
MSIGGLKDYLAIASAIIAVTTFVLAGLPSLLDAWIMNRAIVGATMFIDYDNAREEWVRSVYVFNAGLQPAVTGDQIKCEYLDERKQLVRDPDDGTSAPNFLQVERSVIPGRTSKSVVTQQSRSLDFGGLPVSEKNLAKVDLAYLRCRFTYTDISGFRLRSETPAPEPVEFTVPVPKVAR